MKKPTDESTTKGDPISGALAFFASCIRCGTEWDELCQHTYDRAMDHLAALSKIEKRLPPCPPCDIGENTECICHEPLVPKAWMDAAIDERDAAPAQTVNQKLVEALKKLKDAVDEVSHDYGWKDARNCPEEVLLKTSFDAGMALNAARKADWWNEARDLSKCNCDHNETCDFCDPKKPLATLPADKEKL